MFSFGIMNGCDIFNLCRVGRLLCFYVRPVRMILWRIVVVAMVQLKKTPQITALYECGQHKIQSLKQLMFLL